VKELSRWIACITLGLFLGATVQAQDFYPSLDSVRPALVGTKAPDGTLKTIDGSTTTLSGTLGDRPGVVGFYRGNW